MTRVSWRCQRSECYPRTTPELVRQIDDYVSFFLKTPLLSVYDPDPISSLRKRRISTDSHDSAASHADQRINPEQRSSSKLANNSFPTEAKAKKNKTGDSGKNKKKHKKCSKHGHHHCHKSHKHKRHKSGGDPTTSGTKKIHDQKFAVRSPPHAGGRFVKSDQENESSEASQEESEHQNSSDEEVSFCVLYK